MDIDKKLEETSDILGLFSNSLIEWFKQALEEAYQEGQQNILKNYEIRFPAVRKSNEELVENIFKLSDCCEANVSVGGGRTTFYYVCSKCGKPCDVKD